MKGYDVIRLPLTLRFKILAGENAADTDTAVLPYMTGNKLINVSN